MAILVTGTPGTGKTEIAREIAKILKLKYVDVNAVIKKHKLVECHDAERQTNVVDEKKLAKILERMIKADSRLIIDSHLSHYVSPKLAQLCIVAKCDLKELKKRLEKRKYSKEKVRENLDAEIFDICLTEADELGHKLLIVDTTKRKAKEIARNIIESK